MKAGTEQKLRFRLAKEVYNASYQVMFLRNEVSLEACKQFDSCIFRVEGTHHVQCSTGPQTKLQSNIFIACKVYNQTCISIRRVVAQEIESRTLRSTTFPTPTPTPRWQKLHFPNAITRNLICRVYFSEWSPTHLGTVLFPVFEHT